MRGSLAPLVCPGHRRPPTAVMTHDTGAAPGQVTDGLVARSAHLSRHPLIQVTSRRPWQGWTAQRLAATAALTPITAWFFHSAAGRPAWNDLGWTVAVVGLAVLGALVWSTYIPATLRPTGSGASGSSPCAKVAGFHVLAAGMLLSLNPTLPMVLLALAVQAMALHQRTTGACASR